MKKILFKTTIIQKNTSCKQAGFTMIELLLYMGIFSILLVVLLQIFTSILSVHAESESSSSIDQEMSYVLNRLTYDIHRASDVTSPNIGGSSSTLVLHVGASDFTYLSTAGSLKVSNGGVSNALTSDDVDATVQFSTLGNTIGSIPNPKKTVTIVLTLTSKILRYGGRAVSDTYTTTVQTR